MLRPHRAPVDELVLTVLSQNTNDRNRDVAYGRLRERFSSWDEVRDAPVAEIEDAIRPGGLAPTKAVRIKQILQAIGDDDLSWMEDGPLGEARDYLCELPGVGRKTAACVLLFSYGRPDVPVDTHVYRVGTRLGLWPEKTQPRGGPRRDAPARRSRGRVRDPRAADPARPPHLHRAQPRLSRVPAQAHVPRGAQAAGGTRMSEVSLRRLSELALVAIASVWGLTFVMVQDAIRELPTMAFLAYRFIPAALIVAVVFHRQLRAPARRGLARRARDGRLPHGRLRLPDARPRGDERVQHGLHHRPVRGAHPDPRRDLPAPADHAAGLGGGRRGDGRPLAPVRRQRRLQPARRRARVPVRDRARRAHPRHRERGAPLRRGRAARRAARRGGARVAGDRRPRPATSRRPRARPSGPRSS